MASGMTRTPVPDPSRWIDPQAAPGQRLLAAAEVILLTDGFRSLTTRTIATAAETNVSQIRYYFNGLDGLLNALLLQELAAVSAAFQVLPAESQPSIADLMQTLLGALRTPAAHTRDGFAAIAIEEIYQCVGEDSRLHAAAMLDLAHAPFRAALARQLPQLDGFTIRLRLAGVIAMAMGMLPRGTGRRLLQLNAADEGLDEERIQAKLQELCVAAWG